MYLFILERKSMVRCIRGGAEGEGKGQADSVLNVEPAVGLVHCCM